MKKERQMQEPPLARGLDEETQERLARALAAVLRERNKRRPWRDTEPEERGS